MKVVVLTTSYPRGPGDVAGLFVADQVEHLRERGVEVEVVSPASFRHYGIAYGSGVAGNLRRRPYLAAALPLMLAGFARAARRAARDGAVDGSGRGGPQAGGERRADDPERRRPAGRGRGAR